MSLSLGVQRIIKKCSVPASLLLASLVAVSTHFMIGFPAGHSVNFNFFLQEHFTEQLFSDEILPRWLFNAFHGLGAPVFYFYAPLPFYLFSLINLLVGSASGDFTVLTIGHMAMFLLAGTAFYVFINKYTDRFWALVTSIAYMFLPYHYVDVEFRASMGESLAYVWIPLILVGTCRPEKTWANSLFSACCYAGLILSHLPSALLVAPAIALFSIYTTRRPGWMRGIGHALVIGIIGVALSAFYVLPAVMLRGTLPYDAWVTGAGPQFHVAEWLIPNLYIYGFGLRVYSSLAATSLLGAAFTIAYIFIGHKNQKKPEVAQPDRHLMGACWLLLGACWFLMTRWSWPVWEYVPFLSQVQFPWRLGILVDFVSLFLIALFAPHVMPVVLSRLGVPQPRLRLIERVLVSCGLGASVILVMWRQFPSTVQSRDELTEYLPIEYRPKWLVESAVYLPSGNVAALKDRDVARHLHDRGMDRWQDYIKALPSIASLRDLESGESVSIHSDDITRATISTVLESPATLRVKKLYYPHWRLTQADETKVNVRADAQTGLLLVDLPPGRHMFILDRRILPLERVGMFVSFLTVVVSLVGLAVFSRQTRETTAILRQADNRSKPGNS